MNQSGRRSSNPNDRCPYCKKELVISGLSLVCPRPFATAFCEVYTKPIETRPLREVVAELEDKGL